MMANRAIVEWTCEGDFAANAYSRRHAWRFDGVEVPASSSPAVVPPPLSDPAAVDPEEALVASVASCHMLWFLSLAREAGHVVRSYRDAAEGVMGRNADGRIAMVRIRLDPRIRFETEPDADEIDRLHREAHDRCFIANSLKTEIVVAGSTAS